jgi:hypothetical protein
VRARQPGIRPNDMLQIEQQEDYVVHVDADAQVLHRECTLHGVRVLLPSALEVLVARVCPGGGAIPITTLDVPLTGQATRPQRVVEDDGRRARQAHEQLRYGGEG